MTRIYQAAEIRDALGGADLVAAMERAFVAWSSGRAVVPPVGELLFEDPPGDVHIKYGYVRGDDYYVIKIASGFYENPVLGLPSSNGLMLLFEQKTGALLAVLLDEGYLTDLRTAAAGAVAARWLAPRHLTRIGILGTGIQAELQLRALASVVECRKVLVCGRRPEGLEAYCVRLQDSGFEIELTADPMELAESCELIATTTPSREPLLQQVRPGTHITAMGSDTPEKQELSGQVMGAADVIAVDSIAQAGSRGEAFRAVSVGAVEEARLVELGAIIAGDSSGRTHDEQITVADLTGVATQDIEIAKTVYESLQNAH